MNRNYGENEDALIVEQIQSFLQEKRTALKAIRMGIAVILAQISAVGFLVVVFRHHTFIQELHWMGILVVLGVILVSTTIYLFVYPLIRIHRVDRKILKFKRAHRELGCHETR